MRWPQLITAMDRKAKQTTAQLEEAQVFELNLNRGECREAVVGSAIRPWLPERYGLGSGEVVGADGSQSKALDIVIYDALYSVVFATIGGKLLCPAESVFGTIEVKTTLNTDELIDSIRKGQPLAAIEREQTDVYQFTPTAGIKIGQGLDGDRRPRHHYFIGIVAVDSIDPAKLLGHLGERMIAGEHHLPDMVVCLMKNWIIAKVKRKAEEEGKSFTLGGTEWEYDGYSLIETGTRTVTLMNLLLQDKLQNIKLPKSQAEHILTEALKGIRPTYLSLRPGIAD